VQGDRRRPLAFWRRPTDYEERACLTSFRIVRAALRRTVAAHARQFLSIAFQQIIPTLSTDAIVF
jgi:hypothetical protein